jgi:hypothetical protein
VTLPVIGYDDHLTVTVTAVSSTTRRGPAATARV